MNKPQDGNKVDMQSDEDPQDENAVDTQPLDKGAKVKSSSNMAFYIMLGMCFGIPIGIDRKSVV